MSRNRKQVIGSVALEEMWWWWDGTRCRESDAFKSFCPRSPQTFTPAHSVRHLWKYYPGTVRASDGIQVMFDFCAI